MAQPTVKVLGPDEIPSMQALRREALAAVPYVFSASIDDDRTLDADFVARSVADPAGSVIFLAWENSRPVGMVGAYREEKLKHRHRAQIWGMYVAPSARGRGVGNALLGAAVGHVRAWPGVRQVQLCVTSAAVDARRLYERAGFRVWGCEPAALRWKSLVVDEYHLRLPL